MSEVKEAPKPKTGNGSPFTFRRRFAEVLDQPFEEFGLQSGWHLPSFLTRGHELLRRETGFVPAEWSPKVDVLQREGQFVVHADLPGLSKDGIKVEVND